MPNIKSIFHINVNVTNFERSLKFYEMLGFHVVRDFGEFGDPSLARGLGAKECHGRAVLMILGDDLHDAPGPYRMEGSSDRGPPLPASVPRRRLPHRAAHQDAARRLRRAQRARRAISLGAANVQRAKHRSRLRLHDRSGRNGDRTTPGLNGAPFGSRTKPMTVPVNA
jgi:catechol 2,3-dioxygenase-like lactoylglutathione lyase family enzyme